MVKNKPLGWLSNPDILKKMSPWQEAKPSWKSNRCHLGRVFQKNVFTGHNVIKFGWCSIKLQCWIYSENKYVVTLKVSTSGLPNLYAIRLETHTIKWNNLYETEENTDRHLRNPGDPGILPVAVVDKRCIIKRLFLSFTCLFILLLFS